MLQQLIEAELSATIGARPHERTDTRTAQRNGHRLKLISTAAGDIELQIPKLRTGSFFPSLVERRRRIDRALFAVVMEAWVHGVSTRKVDDLVKALGATTGSPSRRCRGSAPSSTGTSRRSAPAVPLGLGHLHLGGGGVAVPDPPQPGPDQGPVVGELVGAQLGVAVPQVGGCHCLAQAAQSRVEGSSWVRMCSSPVKAHAADHLVGVGGDPGVLGLAGEVVVDQAEDGVLTPVGLGKLDDERVLVTERVRRHPGPGRDRPADLVQPWRTAGRPEGTAGDPPGSVLQRGGRTPARAAATTRAFRSSRCPHRSRMASSNGGTSWPASLA